MEEGGETVVRNTYRTQKDGNPRKSYYWACKDVCNLYAGLIEVNQG